jgi:hypothetical protein
MQTQNWYLESSLAFHLGISRDSLQELRKDLLKKNEAKKFGRQAAINETGLARILKKLGSSELDCTDCLLHDRQQTNGAEVVELVVTKVFPNPRLVQAAHPTDANARVLVSVSNNRNFLPKMKLKARPPGEPPAPQLYRLEGRCPRFRGKW